MTFSTIDVLSVKLKRNYLYGLYLESGSNPVIQNSIVYGNGISGQGQNIYLSSSAPVISYSLLSDATIPPGAVNGGNNILNQNPIFSAPERLDFSLQVGSPCINAANPVTSGLFLPELDLAGNPRIFDNERIDMGAYELQATVQKLQLPEGWSGISSFIIPHETATESIFSPVVNELVILQNFDGMYWPYAGVNTIPVWNDKGGYQIKMDTSQQIYFAGTRQYSLTFGLSVGWNYLPVLNSCINQSSELFSQITNKFGIVKEIAGGKVYWPQFNINTLDEIVPGKAYFILMNEDCELAFPVCEGLRNVTNNQPNAKSKYQRNWTEIIPWKFNIPSAVSHIIAIPENALSENFRGKIVAVFNVFGNCFGFSVLERETTALTIFGDDALTTEKDGFLDGEPIFFKMYDPETKVETNLVAEFDPTLPDYDGTFKPNGLSAIQSLKTEAMAIIENQNMNIRIFPNPAHDRLNIIIGMAEIAEVKFLNIHGQPIKSLTLTSPETLLDVSDLPDGIYLVEIVAFDNKTIKRFIKN